MKLTPAMQQYQEMKQQYLDCILFFRIGDFYEVFFEDAHICHKVLDLVLTSKTKDEENKIPMAGIPYHSIDKYIPKLLQNGYKIAIAEQISDPIPWKLVQRKISQIITPGTYVQEDDNHFNYMLSITEQETKTGENYHVAWGDFTIGEYWTKSFSHLGELQKRILFIRPTEIVVDFDLKEKEQFSEPLQQYLKCLVSIHGVPNDPKFYLTNVTKVQTLNSFGQAVTEGRLQAICLLLDYIKKTQQTNLQNVFKISYHAKTWMVMMDDITVKNLEIFNSSYELSERYSLFGVLNTTTTNGWARYLRNLLNNPINDLQLLQERQQHIVRYQTLQESKGILSELSKTYDFCKLMTTILYKKLLPFPFIKLRASLAVFFDPRNQYSSLLQNELSNLGLKEEEKNQIRQVWEILEQSLKPTEEIQWDENFVKEGRNEEIDNLRKIAYHSDELLLEYQQYLVQLSNISNVKLKFVMNQGYFIEITNKDIEPFETWLKEQNPSDPKLQIFRVNTLKGNQRYRSEYLQNIENQILSSKEILQKKETEVLKDLAEKIQISSSLLNEFAQKVAELDVFCSHAIFASEYQYIQPTLTTENPIIIEKGRHPVIEQYLPRDQQFIPNDIAIGDQQFSDENRENGLVHIITGPNMGGKSTYLRQTALIILLAHCGLFVPAKRAKIWLVDGIFARVWSGDVIAKNQSTFMTEMIEVSNILNNATEKSLIIFDELGRGTSTYDGIALTSAILQYILQKIKAKTLLATHYHELIALEDKYPQIKNFSVSVYETEKDVVFLKKITKWGANKSYGIDVAKIAWIPDQVLQISRKILEQLETKKSGNIVPQNQMIQANPLFQITEPQLSSNSSEYEQKYQKIKEKLSEIDISNTTPLQALQILATLKGGI